MAPHTDWPFVNGGLGQDNSCSSVSRAFFLFYIHSVRPLGEHGVGDVVVHDSSTSSLIIGVDRSFTFDHIFPPEAEQDAVYEALVAPLTREYVFFL